MKQFHSADRATTELEEAYECFRSPCANLSGFSYVKSAQENMLACRKLMAEHELLYGGCFPAHEKIWTRLAALHIYRGRNFKDIPEVEEHARGRASPPIICQPAGAEQAGGVRDKREGSWKDWFRWL